jgi:hypothetical protein
MHLELIDLARPGPLERLEGLDDREAGLADTPLDAALLPLQGLPFDQAGQVIHMPPLVCGGLPGPGLVVFADKHQLQIVQMRGQCVRGRGLGWVGIAHGLSSVSVSGSISAGEAAGS